MSKPILILNGPNLNMLGLREPGVYGTGTLADLETRCQTRAGASGVEIDFRQSNCEGELVTWVQQARDGARALILNAGAFTHTSVALRDAVLASELTCIEVHLSNVFAREKFRHHSYLSDIALGVITGFGPLGYEMAIDAVLAHVDNGKI